MTIDVARARAETPGCQHVLHFNNAGAALMPDPVLAAMRDHLDLEARLGGYEAQDQAAERLERTYDVIANLINGSRSEIAVVENATRAWDMAFYALPFAEGDRVLTSRAEYASNFIAYLQMARRRGVVIESIPNDETGQVDVGRLRDMLDDRVRLIAVTHVPTNGGLVNPAAAIGRVAREAGVWYLLDACQSVGQLPVDVEAIGCDLLSATGRKYLRGPRGTGFLYARRSLCEQLEPPFLDDFAAEWTSADAYEIRDDARRFETWEGNVAAKLGLSAAVDYALAWGLDAVEQRVLKLSTDLRERLAALPGVTLRDLGERQCGIVSFTTDRSSPGEIEAAMATDRINVLVSPRKYTLLDMHDRGLEAVVRASVHYYNTEDEVVRFVDRLDALLAGR